MKYKLDYNFIKNKIDAGESYIKIAKTLNVYPQVIQTFCKQNDLESKAKHFEWTPKNINFLKKSYLESKLTNKEIANVLGTTLHSVAGKAKELKLKKDLEKLYLVLTQENKDFIQSNYPAMTMRKISKEINRDIKTVSNYIHENMKINKPIILKLLDENESFKKDFYNPAISHSALAKEYNLSATGILRQRKKLIGDYKQMTDTFLCKSSAEIEFEKILSELDLTYFYEYKIDKWKVDYYLGRKIIIEIQGEYWHSLNKVKEKDVRKIKELKVLGYDVIEIKDTELINKNKIKNLICNHMGLITE